MGRGNGVASMAATISNRVRLSHTNINMRTLATACLATIIEHDIVCG